MDNYVTAKQIAQALGLSKSGFYALYRQGKFPAGIKIGHSRRWKSEAIQDWLNRKEGEFTA